MQADDREYQTPTGPMIQIPRTPHGLSQSLLNHRRLVVARAAPFARPGAVILVVVATIGAINVKAVAETSCKSWFLGVCTARHTAEEQAKIDADEALRALLRDPVRAAPELERRLRSKVRYWNGVLLIQDEILHGTTTLPATIPWSIDCLNAGHFSDLRPERQ